MNESKSGDSSLHDWFSKSRSSDGKPGWVQLGGKYAGKPCAKQPGQTTKPKCGSSKMKRNLDADEEERAFRRKNREDPNPNRKGKAKNVATEEMNLDEKCWKGYTQKGMKKKGNKVVPNCVPVGEQVRPIGVSHPLKTPEQILQGIIDKDKSLGGGKVERYGLKKANEEVVAEEGKKDACYKKVKSRYSVWPSAYASGALVKCRKVGAANWGNSTKKEEFALEAKNVHGDIEVPSSGLQKLVKKAVKRIDTDVDGDVEHNDKHKGEYGEFVPTGGDPRKAQGRQFTSLKSVKEAIGELDEKCWKGYEKKGMKTMFGKRYPNCVKKEEVEKVDEAAAWTRKAGKNKEGGLNEKGRKSYERENPGSDLKAPSKKVGNPRRKSFCARMSGMKKKLTSSKTANDPNSRINKSLRAWNC